MQKRDYQEKHISEVVDAIENHRTVVAQLPTGGGKTVEFGEIVKMYLRNHIDIEMGPTLILVHREELLYQAAKSVKEILGFEPCLITSDTDRFWIARVYIGMVESTMSRLHMIVNPSLIIIDECHIQNFNKVHKFFKNAKILGWSATPISASKKEPLKNYYSRIICGPQIKQLIKDGYLSQNITRAPDNGIDLNTFQYDRLIGDYNQRQLAQTYSMSNNIEQCINKYWDFCLHKKTLIFNVNIEHSKEVNRYFNVCGIPSKHLDSNSKDRAEIFEWFKTTPNAVLNSVMIPTMGFDEPTVEAVMLNFSTLSLVKFIQTCGRGSRIIDEYFIEKFQHDYPYPLKLKSTFDIIDMGSNWKNFGDWNDERNWERLFWYPDLPGDGVAPVKTCHSCKALVHAAVRMCPYCEYIFPKKPGQQIDMEEMILITKGIDVNALTERSEKKYKYYPFFALAVDVVQTMQETYGKEPSQNVIDRFFRIYFNLCVEWYSKSLGKEEDEIDDISNSMWHINKAKNNFNSLILKNSKNSLIVQNNYKDVIHKDYPDNVKQKEKDWNNLKHQVL